MANANRPSGFTPIRHITGSPWNGALEIFYHSASNASAIYKGSLVRGDQGLDNPLTDPLGIYQTCYVAADDFGLGVVGVAWSFGDTPQLGAQVSNLNAKNYCPASVGMYIGVITDHTVVFKIQDNGTAVSASQIGDYFDTSNNAAGSTATGRTTCVLDADSLVASGGAGRILKRVNRPDNEMASNADWEVLLEEHIFRRAYNSTAALTYGTT